MEMGREVILCTLTAVRYVLVIYRRDINIMAANKLLTTILIFVVSTFICSCSFKSGNGVV